MVVAFAVALLIKTFLLQAFFIPSASMEPTLREGDRVLVEKVGYVIGEPARGQVDRFREGSRRHRPARARRGPADRHRECLQGSVRIPRRNRHRTSSSG